MISETTAMDRSIKINRNSHEIQRSSALRSIASPSLALPTRFCFEAELGDVLRTELAQDIEFAKLSTAFRCYYRMRPFLPRALRQLIQKLRNKRLVPEHDWYFSKEIEHAVQQLAGPLASIWPDGAEYALVLTHDIEEQAGFRDLLKLADIEEKLGFRSSWNIVPYKYKIDEGIVKELKARGNEIGIQGFNHDGQLFLSKSKFDSRVKMINLAIERFDAVGFRAPMAHRNLLWMQQLNIEYDSSCFDRDPFQAMPGGVGGIWPFVYGKFVELPYTLPQDHTLFVTLGETTDRIWRDKLEFIRRHHGMALMLTHPDYLDSPSRRQIYRDFLCRLRDTGNAWHVLPREIARWFAKEL